MNRFEDAISIHLQIVNFVTIYGTSDTVAERLRNQLGPSRDKP